MADDHKRAGALRERLHFQRRGDQADGWGGAGEGAGPFTTEFTLHGALRPLRGTETVMAARIEGRQPYVVTVRAARRLSEVTGAWRIVDARNANRVFAITGAPVDPDGTNAWREILVTEGAPS